ncbi:MAG: sulfurtransferase [Acidimicrobiales bacterium]|nr:sulfurtransferase [Acidimicrobiales bacterium]
MLFHQYQLGCLSLFSYLVGDERTGRAVVIDPQRDIGQYLADADAGGLQIERVIETHVHADFVSGHLELARATGAAISYGAGADVEFPIEPLVHGTRLVLGDVELEVRATPGHTPESISLVVWDGGAPWGVLTGDTLFIGDVGRPDLLAAAGTTADALARQLHHSLHEQLLTLPDATRVFPAHGAGSSCGKALSAATESTIGEQRATNYALQPMDEETFVTVVTEGQSVPPPYFAFASTENRRAHSLLDDVVLPRLHLADVPDDAVVLDCRAAETFASGHLRGSLNVGIDGRFAEYVGDVVAPGRPVVLVTDPGREDEARVRLARIGFDTVVGAIANVDALLTADPERAATAARLPAADVATWAEDAQVVDVRNPGEVAGGGAPGAVAIPLAALVNRLGELDPGRPVVVYCAGGYRSSIAASVLRAAGFERVADVLGGWPAWQAVLAA